MRRKTKCGIVVTVVMLLASAWIWRYVALNRLFEENYLPFPVEYAMGKEVEYGKTAFFSNAVPRDTLYRFKGKKHLLLVNTPRNMVFHRPLMKIGTDRGQHLTPLWK